MTEWQDIDTAPKDGTVILLYAKPDVYAAMWCERGDRGGKFPWVILELNQHMITNRLLPHAATHWMPLPDKPKDG